MKIAFGMIVFNSDFVLREVLESIYPYAEQVLIAEGPVKYWDDKGYTTSTDRTNEILESFPDPYNKIKIVRGPYPEKDDMCNKYIEHMNDDIDYIWHVDADEIYKSEDIEKIIELLETNKYTSVGFRCYSFYGGMDRYITGYEENYEFMRLFKVYPGTTWLTHRPPTVKHLENVKKLPDNHLSFEILDKEHGIRIYHYSYVFPRQVYEKISYYKDAVSKDNCRNNYFEEIYMPWVLGDEESKNNVEKNNNGVHEFINRDSTFTKELEKSHPKVITDNLEQLEFVYHSQLKHYFYKINDMTVPILTRIGNPPWDREDLINKLDEFLTLYSKRPIDNNQGGMKAPQMFPVWFLIDRMKFPYIIESGIWYGQGTWFFEQANIESEIHSIDTNLSLRKYISNSVQYYSNDFFNIQWENIVDRKNTLCFFDDHQDALPRVKYAVDNGFRYLVFEDNYPTNRGDCVSLKKIFDEGGLDAEWLRKVIKTYYEFPPILKLKKTRWNDSWNEADYPTPYPLLDSFDESKKSYENEIDQYTWICFVELNIKESSNKDIEKTAWYNKDILPIDMTDKSNEWKLEEADHFGYLKESFDICKGSESVVDLGCGAGNVGKVFNNINYTGYDLDHIIEKVSKKVNPNLSYVSFDAHHTDFEFCKNYDIILSNSFITELRDCGNILFNILNKSNRYVILHRQGFSDKEALSDYKTYGDLITSNCTLSSEEFYSNIEGKFNIIYDVNHDYDNGLKTIVLEKI